MRFYAVAKLTGSMSSFLPPLVQVEVFQVSNRRLEKNPFFETNLRKKFRYYFDFYSSLNFSKQEIGLASDQPAARLGG